MYNEVAAPCGVRAFGQVPEPMFYFTGASSRCGSACPPVGKPDTFQKPPPLDPGFKGLRQ